MVDIWLKHELCEDIVQNYFKNIVIDDSYWFNGASTIPVLILRLFASQILEKQNKRLLLTRHEAYNDEDNYDYTVHILSNSATKIKDGMECEALQQFLANRGSTTKIIIKDNHYYLYKVSEHDVATVFTAIASWGKSIFNNEIPKGLREFCLNIFKNEENLLISFLNNTLEQLPNYKENKQREMLNKFTSTFFEEKKRRYNSEIINLRSRIDEYNRYIFDYISQLKQVERNMAFLRDTEGMDFANYFSSVNYAEAIKIINENTLRCRIFTYLDNTDVDIYKNTKEQNGSYIEEFIKQYPQTEELLDKIFLTQEVTIGQVAEFDLNIFSGYVEAFGNADYPPDNYAWNIHANSYNCMGEYKTMISRAILEGDYIAVLEILKNFVGSLNLSDVTVAKNMLHQIYNMKDKPILKIISTGEIVTPESLFTKSDSSEECSGDEPFDCNPEEDVPNF